MSWGSPPKAGASLVFSLRLLYRYACFPGTVVALTAWAGIETPSNLIFLLAIVGLLGLCFSLSIIVSRQEAKLKRIIQLLSLDQREWKGRDKLHDPEKEED